MGDYRRLWHFVARYRFAFAVSLGAAAMASVLDGLSLVLLIPLFRLLFGASTPVAAEGPPVEQALGQLLAFTLPDRAGVTVGGVVLVILGVIVIKNIAAFGAGALSHYVQEAVSRDLRMTLHRHVHRLDLASLGTMRTGQLLSRLLTDADQAKGIVSEALVTALRHVAVVVVYVGLLLGLSWRFALVTLIIAPLVAVGLRPLLGGIRARARGVLDERGEMMAIATESVEGMRSVKAYGGERQESRRFGAAADRYFRGMVRVQSLSAVASPVSETLGAIVLVLLLLLATTMPGLTLRPELFVAFATLSLRLLPPVKRLAQFPMQAEVALAAARRIFEVLDRPTEGDGDTARAVPFRGLGEAIEFRDVWVRYEDGDWVLRGVDLRVPAGKVVAVVGRSGAGKSTLADLLPRFVSADRGAVVLDGRRIEAYDRTTLRRGIGIVDQHPTIFNDTVRANIAYGDMAGVDDAAVVEAAIAANAHDFILRLARGYDTVLGERGTRLSGGGRQRIAIARAVLKNPSILILDEATAHLDAEAERLVQDALVRISTDRTVLVIAHRLATVALADVIVVLDEGRVVERGCHEELVAGRGVYSQLHALLVDPARKPQVVGNFERGV
jgi:subfamily B ATP-binding cassette protein MsbA